MGAGVQNESGRSHLGWVWSWVIGAALVFVVAPFVRTRVPLSDELDLGSIILPVWTFLQLVLLAGLLKWLRPRSATWSAPQRVLLAVGCALAVGVLQPTVLSLLSRLGDETAIPLSRDPLQVALLWSTPLLFYAIPAGIVTVAWVRWDSFRLSRVLGLSLVALGLLNVGAIFWFTHLWARYVNV